MTRPLLAAAAVLLIGATMSGAVPAQAAPTTAQTATPAIGPKFAADFRTNWPDLAGRFTDTALISHAQVTCLDIAAGELWDPLLAKVRSRYGVDDYTGRGILSLIGAHCAADFRQP